MGQGWVLTRLAAKLAEPMRKAVEGSFPALYKLPWHPTARIRNI